VRGLITAILGHPDGFTGEVVLVENCEGGTDYYHTRNNAENPAQSYQAVVDTCVDPGRVSTSSWWSFADNVVGDFDGGDMRQGYVPLGANVSYPKFVTGWGRAFSLAQRHLDGSGYDKSRLN